MRGGIGMSTTCHHARTNGEAASEQKPSFHADDFCSFLLELAANNDPGKFQESVEEEMARIDIPGTWYTGKNGSREMVLERRTPIMIASLYGSLDVLKYIVEVYSRCGGDINHACGSDGATALHCAVAGSSAEAVETARFLIDSGADVDIVDAMGRTPMDLVRVSYRQGSANRTDLEQLFVGRKPNRTRLSEEATSDVSDNVMEPFIQRSPVSRGAIGRSGALSVSSSSLSISPKSPQLIGSKLGNEKLREYPVDPSLPDIKSTIYMTDEFRMYTFKVWPCSRAYSHDWTECPFVHPGENARRRDPRKYHYSCVPCPDFRKGACGRGDLCDYAHGVFECWLHPAQYRTRLCKDGTDCHRRVCFFAHTPEELRPLYVSTGSAVPSPRSSACLDMSVMNPPITSSSSLMMMPPFSPSYSVQNTFQSCFATPPMSPQSSSANTFSRSLSSSQPNVPVLHLPGSSLQGSRLRAALNARDACLFTDSEDELLEEFQSSLSMQALSNAAIAAPGSGNMSSRARKYRNLGLSIAPTNLDEIFTLENVSSARTLGHEANRLSEYEAQIQSTRNHMCPPQTSSQLKIQPQQAISGIQLSGTALKSPKNLSSASTGPTHFVAALEGMDKEKQESHSSPALLVGFHERLKQRRSSPDQGGGTPMSDWGSSTGKPEWGVNSPNYISQLLWA